MTRHELISELERSALLNGFAFRTGPVYGINARIGSEPEIWADMPSLSNRQGRNEGRRTYRVDLRAVALSKDPARGEQLIDLMTAGLSDICLSMCDNDNIVDIPALEYQTEKDTLTNKGEVSVKATLTVNTRF